MKQRYQVQPQSETPQQEDASFRVCLCTMLVILALFGLTSFFLWLSIDPQRGPDKVSGDNPASDSSSLYGHVKQNPTTTRDDPSKDKEKVQTHDSVIHNETVVTNHPSTDHVTETSTRTTPVSNTKISVKTKQAQTTTSHSPSEVTTKVPIVTIINETETSKSTTVDETESSTGYYINNPVTWNSEGIYIDDNVTEETNESSTTSYINDPVIFNSSQSYFINTSAVESSETTSYYISNPVVWNPGSSYFENTTSVSESNLKVTTESSTESFSQLNLTGIPQKTEDSSVISSTITTTEVQYIIQNNSLIDKINKLVKEFEVETFSTTENDVDESEDNVGKNMMKSERLVVPFETTTEEVSSIVTPGSSSNTVANESNITELTSTHSTITNSSVDDTAANESDITESTSTHSTSTESSVEKAETVTEETATSALSENSTKNTDYEEYTPQDSSTSSEAVFMSETSTARTCSIPAAPACPVCPTLQNPTTTTVTETTPAIVDKVCETKECYATAGRMLSLVDVTVDPCEDFYSYACGGILDNPTVLEEDPEIDVWDRMKKAVKAISPLSPASHQKLKNYYEGCVHYDKLISEEERKIEGRKILDSVGLFVNATSDPQNDFTELLISLFKHGSEPLFRLQLDVDSTNSSFFQMAITVPDWSSSHFRPAAERNKKCRHKPSDKIPEDLRVAYSAYTNCKNNFSNFMETTQKALEYFGVFDYMDHFESAQLIQEIRISIEFDILELLAELPTPDVVQDSIQKKDYKLIIKPQLEATIPQISWSFLFSTLLNVELDDSSYVQVYFLDEISNFFNKLQTKDVRTVHNSLLAVFAHDLYKDLMLTHSPCDREQYCLHVAASLMPAVVSNLYLGTFPADTDRDLRTQVTSLYSKLKATMKEKLVEADWLDNKTRNQVEKKLNFMSIELPQMFNESFLNTSLEECNLDKKHYMEDSVCLVRQYQTLLYSRYTLNPDSVDVMWPHFLTAFSTHTAFIYGLNTFMIPLAVVGHVYDSQLPRHVVMARLGNILARGLGHNFDYTGIKFDATGKIGIMLSEDTNPSYTTVVDNSNSQFIWTKSHKENSRFYMYLLQPGLTLNQRLSDITAANLSLSTVLELQDTKLPWVPFNSRQVYFIALAQTFCSKKKMPEVFTTLYEGTTLLPFDRITNLVSNSEQFAVAFSCALGANMHPEFKVRPFPLFEKVENTLNYVDTY